MAQVVAATRPIHTSVPSTISGSLQSQVEKLKPSGFASKLLARNARKSYSAVRFNLQITAKRSARVEAEVRPVTPEDIPKVRNFFWNYSFFSFIEEISENLLQFYCYSPLIFSVVTYGNSLLPEAQF